MTWAPNVTRSVKIQNIGHRKIVGQGKDGLQEAAPLQIDEYGGVGDEDHFTRTATGPSMRRLSSRSVRRTRGAVQTKAAATHLTDGSRHMRGFHAPLGRMGRKESSLLYREPFVSSRYDIWAA